MVKEFIEKVENIETVLEGFHREELKKRPEWCRKYMDKECSSCSSVWCCLHKKYEIYDKPQVN